MLDGLVQVWTRLSGYSPWKVAAQLALIWLVVFTIFQFLRGSRGARALKGLFLVMVVAMISAGAFGGDTDFAPLQFLTQRFLGFVTLAMVIVFHPEIRRALVRLGEARLFRGGGPAVESMIDELCAAAEYLSRHKIGAIIAIERSVGLEGVIEPGTKIDGRLSADLLKTIFWPGTALHDMGVVVRGDRVIAAGVQFPLAEGEELDQELGSRHRAAIGLSQETDCLVLVVSEETGSIGLAERGQLMRKIPPDDLRAMLRRGISVAESVPPGSGLTVSLKTGSDDEERPPTSAAA